MGCCHSQDNTIIPAIQINSESVEGAKLPAKTPGLKLDESKLEEIK